MSEQSVKTAFRDGDLSVKLKMSVLITLMVVVVTSSVASMVWIWKTHQGPDREPAAHEEHEVAATPSYTFAYELKQVSMAVMDKAGNRTGYAQFTLILDCPTPESKKLMELNRAKLLDGIFEVGSNFVLEDFASGQAPKTFEKFKGGLKELYTKHFGASTPREIVFKDWFLN